MNGTMQDEMEQAIQKVIDKFSEDERRWPSFFAHLELAKDMTAAAANVFDTCVRCSNYTESETK